ncbi:methyltransferase [archaeon]|nr:methyltransferase [archaeon]
MIYKGAEFEFCPDVYEPSDDSFLLGDNIKVKRGERVLDMGTGCGIQGIIASKMGGVVASSDISDAALKCAGKNAKLNSANMTFAKSDLFRDIKGEFDLVMFNPPYLPAEPGTLDDMAERSLAGGKTGSEITMQFLKELKNHLSPDGRALLVTSTLSIQEFSPDFFAKHGLRSKIIDKKPLFFEKLYLFMLRC